jgi:hypothetical protein
MEINPQTIRRGDNIEFAVLPYMEYLKMKEMIEDYEDLISLRKAKLEDSDNEGISAYQLLKEIENNS